MSRLLLLPAPALADPDAPGMSSGVCKIGEFSCTITSTLPCAVAVGMGLLCVSTLARHDRTLFVPAISLLFARAQGTPSSSMCTLTCFLDLVEGVGAGPEVSSLTGRFLPTLNVAPTVACNWHVLFTQSRAIIPGWWLPSALDTLLWRQHTHP